MYVVGPDADSREGLRAMLDRVDCTVRTYVSPAGFLADREDDGSGCLVTWHRTRGPSGLDLVKRLAGSDLPTIVLTGRGDVRAAVEAMHAGAAACLETPCVRRVLLDQIRRLLR